MKGRALLVAIVLAVGPVSVLAKPPARRKPAPAASAASASTSTPTPTPTPTSTSAAAPAPTGNVGGCVETLPQGAARPTLTEAFPARGLSGYAAVLHVVVDHGRGETVLPRGLDLQSESDSAKALKSAGFVIPDQDGGAAARLIAGAPDAKHEGRTSTVVDLPLVPLPAEPGRHTLTLPPVPIAVARASGDIATACTHEHTIVVDDPIASTPDPRPLPNPPPRPQREEWTTLRQAVTIGAIGLVVGAVLAYLVRKWMLRPKPVPPPPPPRPPWEVALEKLDEVRHAGLLEVGRFQDYFDRVNDAVRAYLGARYGFDGLESTTDEIVHELRRTFREPEPGEPQALGLPGVIDFLTECDLVKFAKFTPTQQECQEALASAERIVRTTMPSSAAALSPELPTPVVAGGGSA